MACGCEGLSVTGNCDCVNGIFGGYSSNWVYDNSSLASGAPTTYLRFNSTTPSAVTSVFLNTTNKPGGNMDAFIDSFKNTISAVDYFGYIRVFDELDSAVYAYYQITAVTTPGAGLRTLTVTYVDGAGTFTGGKSLVVSFVPTGKTGTTGSAGGAGTNGTNGAAGIYGGYSLAWKHETSVAAGATSGYFRLNNATYSTVTQIFVSTTTSDSVAATNFLASLDNSALFGWVKIAKQTDATKFWMGKITATANSGAYYTITVTFTNSNSAFSANDDCFLTFVPGINISTAVLVTGKLPSFPLVGGNRISDGVTLVPGPGTDVTTLEQDVIINAYDQTTGIWTCPTNGYYNFNFLISTSDGLGIGQGTGYYIVAIADSTGTTVIAYDTIILVPSMDQVVIQSAYTYRKCVAGNSFMIRLLNRSSKNIVGNANGDGGVATQGFHFTITRVA